MLNHSSATPHTIKSTKNLNGRDRAKTRHVNKSATNKTPNLNGRSKKTDKKSVPGAVATGSQVANNTLNRNSRSKKTQKKSVPGAVATGYHVAKNTLPVNGTSKTRISKAVKRRAQSIIKDRAIDAESRAIIRYGLETNDPWLPELVRRVGAGEAIIETIVLLKHP